MSRVCVIGSFMMDLVVSAPRRPLPGETVLGTGFNRYLGGKGFNQAIAAARAGASTSMVGRLGDDEYGREFRERLAIDGIDDTYVFVDSEHGTGIGNPLVEESGENSIVVIPRANSALCVDDVSLAAPAIARADVLLLQLELPIETTIAASRIARESGTRVILNPAPARHDLDELFGTVDLLVPNEREACMLLGADRPDLARLADRWKCAVVMTMGRGGCAVSDGNGQWASPAFEVSAVDTVGAGDAFCGTLATWLAQGASLEEALLFANAAGALAVTRPGAEPSMPTRSEILAKAAPALAEPETGDR